MTGLAVRWRRIITGLGPEAPPLAGASGSDGGTSACKFSDAGGSAVGSIIFGFAKCRYQTSLCSPWLLGLRRAFEHREQVRKGAEFVFCVRGLLCCFGSSSVVAYKTRIWWSESYKMYATEQMPMMGSMDVSMAVVVDDDARACFRL